jgi:hypothetical protein
MNDNPLRSTQRETSGSTTFSKYEYQYHWALCKIIDEQREAKEYALFMEFHEDVVLANSLDCEVAEFEFYQVKNIGSPKYNINNLTKRKGDKSSILGKLIDSAINKPFSKKIDTINLVASCGFSLDQLDNSLNLEVLTIGDLSDSSKKELTEKLSIELGIDDVPENLRFIVPTLGLKDQQDSVIGKISKLISDVFPNSHCDATNIYRALIDELHRKGVISYDYNKWDDLLENKALTSPKVTDAINVNITLPDIKELLDEANEIATEIGLTYLQKKQLRKNIEKIHIESVGFLTSLRLKVRKTIREALTCTKTGASDLNNLLTEVFESLPKDLRSEIGSNDDVMDYIIYEVITGDV